MPLSVVVLSLAVFSVGTQIYIVSGLLGGMSDTLGVGVAEAGQLITAFAVSYALLAPMTVAWVSSYEPRRVIFTALLLLAALNAAAAMTSSFPLLVLLRIGAGAAATLVNPVAASFATTLVPSEKRGRALAFVLAGLTLSFLVGIPLGTAVGEMFGWRAAFVFASCTSVFAAALSAFFLPGRVVPAIRRSTSFFSVLSKPLIGSLLMSFTCFAATFASIAFIGPLITAITGVTGPAVAWFQVYVGVGSLIGIPAGGWLADRAPGRWATSTAFAVICASQLMYVMLVQQAFGAADIFLALNLIIGAAALFALAPIIQGRIVSSAGPLAPLALAMNGSVNFLGQACGAAAGGLSIAWNGLGSVGIAGAIFALVGFFMANAKTAASERKAPA